MNQHPCRGVLIAGLFLASQLPCHADLSLETAALDGGGGLSAAGDVTLHGSLGGFGGVSTPRFPRC